MGLRGPGARPKRTAAASISKRKRKPKWQRKGLSRGDRVIAYIEGLKLTAGHHAGKPFLLRPWQRKIVKGIYDPVTADGLREARLALLTMSRKNGKSQLCAGLALAHMDGPEAEPRGEVYSAASDRNQAGRIFREIEAFALADDDLGDRLNIQRFAKRIEVMSGPGAGTVYEALSSDARKGHSLSPSCTIYDELAQATSRDLYDALMTGQGARAQPLMIVISTVSDDPLHVMNELVTDGERVLAGEIIDPTFKPFIFTTPADADIWDENVWRLSNPALDDFRSLSEMRAFAAKAKRIPSQLAAFKQYYLNMPAATGDDRFIGPEDWKACGAEIDRESLRGCAAWGGLDLSSTTDLTAFSLWFPESGAALAWFWLPGDGIADREERDRVPYRQWAEEGLLTLTPGRVIDKAIVAGMLAEIASEFDVQGIGYDRWRIADLKKSLDDLGIELPMIDFGQGFQSMGPALDALEVAILDKRFLHGNSPILTWNARSARIDKDPAGNRKLSKARSRARIDGLVAAAMALGLHAKQPAPPKYDFDRPLVLSA